MKYLLALDLGVTTGYAVLSQEGRLLEHGVIEYEDIESEVKDLRDRWVVSWSVAEMPVIVRGKLGDRLQRVCAVVRRELMRQVEEVQPADWKGTPASKTPCPRGITQHERDAIRIGRWYLEKS